MEETETRKSIYRERDLNTAAYLVAKGFRVIDLEREGPHGRRFNFCFDEINEDVTVAARQYRLGATIVAKEFAQAMKQLKWMLYEKKGINKRQHAQRVWRVED